MKGDERGVSGSREWNARIHFIGRLGISNSIYHTNLFDFPCI